MKKIVLVKPEELSLQHLAAVENTCWSADLSPLVAFLVRTKYDDGSARMPGEMRLKTKGRTWEVQLIDYDGKAHCRLTSSTLDDVMAMACLGLETEEMPWEEASWITSPKRKK